MVPEGMGPPGTPRDPQGPESMGSVVCFWSSLMAVEPHSSQVSLLIQTDLVSLLIVNSRLVGSDMICHSVLLAYSLAVVCLKPKTKRILFLV